MPIFAALTNLVMKKQLLTLAAVLMTGISALAGGYLTNTNQNVAFLRNPAQTGTIGVHGAYSNPAGVGFLDKGWYLGLNSQTAFQTRQIDSDYAPFALGLQNEGKSKKHFEGRTTVPVIPSFDLAYVHDEHWFGSFHFGITSGGGKANFKDGLGSFESQIAIIPVALNGIVGAQAFMYDSKIKMLGEQYTFSAQLNFGYRLNDNLSFSLGIRGNYLTNHFDASIKDIQFSYAGGPAAPAATVLIGALGNMGMNLSPEQQAAVQGMFADRELDCSQSAIAFNPVIGIDYKIGGLNLAARYEFNTSVRLKNKTAEGKDAGLEQYKDGRDDLAADIPAIFAFGAQYSILENLRVSAGANYYFDKQSKVYNSASGKNDKTDLINGNSFELLGGIEWDPFKQLTVGCGVQYAHFDWGEDAAFLTDQSFNPNSLSVGAGIRYNVTEKIGIDLCVFKSFYSHLTKKMDDYNGVGAATAAKLGALGLPAGTLDPSKLIIPGSDRFYRTSFVFGVGLNFAF